MHTNPQNGLHRKILIKNLSIRKAKMKITFRYRVFIKYYVFSKNSRKFATSPSPALDCYWLYNELLANRSDFTLALR